MKIKNPLNKCLIVFGAIAALTAGAKATTAISGITISDFVLTDSSLEFRIQGCFVDGNPGFYDNSLFFVNTSPDMDFFTNSNLLGANSVSYSGLGSPSTLASTGSFTYGDYIFLNFVTDFVAGQDIDETFSATWDSTVFTPGEVSELDVFWGASDLRIVDSGIYLTKVAVPEPSTSMLVLIATVGFLSRRNRHFQSPSLF